MRMCSGPLMHLGTAGMHFDNLQETQPPQLQPHTSPGASMASIRVEAPDGAEQARTLTASKGQSPMSAKNSAEAEPARNRMVWYLAAISGPAFSAYKLHATVACHC